jgi:hypothetical protein
LNKVAIYWLRSSDRPRRSEDSNVSAGSSCR